MCIIETYIVCTFAQSKETVCAAEYCDCPSADYVSGSFDAELTITAPQDGLIAQRVNS